MYGLTYYPDERDEIAHRRHLARACEATAADYLATDELDQCDALLEQARVHRRRARRLERRLASQEAA